MIGKIISQYKILEKLGEGGMGVVFKAHDTKLDRFVALKFLPPHLTKNKTEKERFIQEAKAASAINHPNVCVIHDIQEHDDSATADRQQFIIMEFVDGETLSDKIKRENVDKKVAIDYAIQIADALKIAHEKGIIHRDIKSENIMINSTGQVKVMDFGLAKLKGSLKLTKTSSTVGTLAYMSPEQIQGGEIDARSDIFSFGVVLYEMLSGHLPFQGEYDSAMMYSILNNEPEPLTKYKSEISERIQNIIEKALDKDLDTRYQHIGDLLVDLRKEKKSYTESKKIITHDRKKSATKKNIIFAIISVFIFFVWYFIFTDQAPILIPVTPQKITFDGNVKSSVISPDGKFLAYASKKNVMLRDMITGDNQVIYEGNYIWSIVWSPDGSEVLIKNVDTQYMNTGSFIVSKLGGNKRNVSVKWNSFSCWSPDGSMIASIFEDKKQIWFNELTTGELDSIPVDATFQGMYDIDWSLVGNRLLFFTMNENKKNPSIWTIKTDGSQLERVIEDTVLIGSPRWSNDGKAIIYFQTEKQTYNLNKISINSETGKPVGLSKVLQTGINTGLMNEWIIAPFSLSKDNKKLVYTQSVKYSNLWFVKDGSSNPKKLTNGTSLIQAPRISPDESQIVYCKDEVWPNLYTWSIEEEKEDQLTYFKSDKLSKLGELAWSPNGEHIVFLSDQDGVLNLCRIRSNGDSPYAFKETNPAIYTGIAWNPGKNILYQHPGYQNLYSLNPETGEQSKFVSNDSSGFIFSPRYSPRGDKIVALWNKNKKSKDETVEIGLWIFSLTDSSRTKIYEGILRPLGWTKDGRWIYTWNLETKILKVPVDGGEPEIFMTLPFENLVSMRTTPIAMTPDGKKVICCVTESTADAFMLEDFDPEVK